MKFGKRNKINKSNQYKPTSGEQLIEYYLYESNIKFETQKKIYNLKGDTKSYRVVDFYLPRLDIYIEYYGMYFSGDKYKKEYDIKSHVYLKNDLATIFLYPNEVGVLDYAFHSKITNVMSLNKFETPRLFFRYTLNRYLNQGKGYLIFTILFWQYLFYVFGYYPNKLDEGIAAVLTLISLFVSIYYFATFIVNLISYFYYRE